MIECDIRILMYSQRELVFRPSTCPVGTQRVLLNLEAMVYTISATSNFPLNQVSFHGRSRCTLNVADVFMSLHTSGS